MNDVKDRLFSLRDERYGTFMARLLPTVDEKKLVGVRLPLIRGIAKNMNDEDKNAFTDSLPHSFYEEYVLHAFLIADISNYSSCVQKIDLFLPYVDNWGVCDSLRPKCFKNNKSLLIEDIKRWLSSSHPYTVRFSIEMLMVHFLDREFSEEHLDWISKINSDEYYVKMMVAWYFATALAKQYGSALQFIEERRLPLWTHKKTIQKALESNCLTSEQKDRLRNL